MVSGSTNHRRRNSIEGLTRPDPREYVQQILAWAICWPWNLVWTVCVYNPFRYVGEFVVKEFGSALDEISSGQFREIESDLSIDELRASNRPAMPTSMRDVDTSKATIHSTAQPVLTESNSAEPQTSAESVEQPGVENTHVAAADVAKNDIVVVDDDVSTVASNHAEAVTKQDAELYEPASPMWVPPFERESARDAWSGASNAETEWTLSTGAGDKKTDADQPADPWLLKHNGSGNKDAASTQPGQNGHRRNNGRS